jgi:dUTPase
MPANGGHEIIKTGILSSIHPKWFEQSDPRNGLTLYKELDILCGVFDFEYFSSEIKVELTNHGKVDVHIFEGDRIAEITIESNPYAYVDLSKTSSL